MADGERTYTVNGMTCGHCVLSVREEVAEVTGAGYELAAPGRSGDEGGDTGR